MGCAGRVKRWKVLVQSTVFSLAEGDELTMFLVILCFFSVVSVQGSRECHNIINLNRALILKGGYLMIAAGLSLCSTWDKEKPTKKEPGKNRIIMLFSLQVNGVTTSEWNRSSTSLLSFCLWLSYSRLQNGLAYTRSGTVHFSEITVFKVAPLSVGKLQVEGIPLKKSQSSVCSCEDIDSISNIKLHGNEHHVLESQNIIQIQVICFYLLVTGLFLHFESIPTLRCQS